MQMRAVQDSPTGFWIQQMPYLLHETVAAECNKQAMVAERMKRLSASEMSKKGPLGLRGGKRCKCSNHDFELAPPVW